MTNNTVMHCAACLSRYIHAMPCVHYDSHAMLCCDAISLWLTCYAVSSSCNTIILCSKRNTVNNDMVLCLDTMDRGLNNGNMLFRVMKASMQYLGWMEDYTAGERPVNCFVIPMLT